MAHVHQDVCTGPEQELVPGRLRGYRWFNYNAKSSLKLGATRFSAHGLPWPIPWQAEMTARCYLDTSRHGWYPQRRCQAPNPDPRHFCGLWGYYRPDLMSRGIAGIDPRPSLGVIEVWGRILLGCRGFRAEKARIIAISYSFSPNSPALKQCEKAGIAVYLNDPHQLYADHPPDDVASLLGAVPTLSKREREHERHLEKFQDTIATILESQLEQIKSLEALGGFDEEVTELRQLVDNLHRIRKGR